MGGYDLFGNLAIGGDMGVHIGVITEMGDRRNDLEHCSGWNDGWPWLCRRFGIGNIYDKACDR